MRDSFYQAVERALPSVRVVPLDEVLRVGERKRSMITRKRLAVLLAVLLLCLTAAGVAWTLTARDIRRRWELEKGPMSGWKLEEKAAFADEVQAADPIWDNAPYRTPQPGEITGEAAKNIAISALHDRYGLTEEALTAFDYQEALTYLDADFPDAGCYYEFTWINHTETAVHPGGDVYLVQVDPGTGEVLSVQSMDDLVG